MKKLTIAIAALIATLSMAACQQHSEGPGMKDPHQPEPYIKLTHPEWSRNATIYQINTRQFTQEGTFAAAQRELPRLKELGVDILWFMPIHPIGEVKRKGTMGSPYSVKDYYGVNPEFGSLDDFKRFVDAAHELGMYVIIDWVANHTAWDNALHLEHPEWYERDFTGEFRPTPWYDWSDIIDLDFSKPGVREYMTEAMKYWVREAGIDGYRCDVAGFVPLQFWNNLRSELDEIKPVFMLAEWEERDLHAYAFDMSYGWTWHEAVHKVVNQKGAMGALFKYYSHNESAWPHDAYRMTFISNHDINSWDYTMFEGFGDGLEAAIVLSVVGEGMPLIYNGQEAGNAKRLEFFEKDPIEWQPHPIGDLYKRLLALRKDTPALWNGSSGARMIRAWNTQPDEVFSFVRRDSSGGVFVAINFSAMPRTVTFSDAPFEGEYTEFFSSQATSIASDFELTLEPWGYRVFVVD